jgi:hypothetical protein
LDCLHASASTTKSSSLPCLFNRFFSYVCKTLKKEAKRRREKCKIDNYRQLVTSFYMPPSIFSIRSHRERTHRTRKESS